MSSLRVAFVSELPGSENAAQSYARFLEDLGSYLGHAVSMTLSLGEVERSIDFVILETGDVERSLARCTGSDQAELARRVVAMYPSRQRGTFHEQMERLLLAGGLEPWAMTGGHAAESEDPGVEGLTGRRAVAAVVEASCNDDLMMPPVGYCFMVSTRHRGLPHLLAEYLVALQSMRQAGGD
jgi:hypothetical protein